MWGSVLKVSQKYNTKEGDTVHSFFTLKGLIYAALVITLNIYVLSEYLKIPKRDL